ncbi:MAG: DUF2927 domain-containing protein [Cytophagales bacterium]|nr:DUF2927 domain-containing protein [Cytophagales bacterium]
MNQILKLTPFLAALLLLGACSSDEEVRPVNNAFEGLSQHEIDVVTYFREIALGFEFGDASRITRKWTRPMRIFVGGEPTQAHFTELDNIINELNGLATDDFEMVVVDDTLQSNYYIFIGPYREYQRMFPNLSELILSNWGLFSIWWDGNQNLNRGQMYVDTERPDERAQLHLLREELTQSLGLARDSGRYPDSIFQQEWTTVTRYMDIDRDLVKVLYHPSMTSGYNTTTVLPILKQIFEDGGLD